MSQLPRIDRQREHQANERTFLAWLRTSIALIGFGFAIARFGIFLKQMEAVMNQTIEAPHPLLNSQSLGVSFGNCWRHRHRLSRLAIWRHLPTDRAKQLSP